MNTTFPATESEGLLGSMAAYVSLCQVLVIEGNSMADGIYKAVASSSNMLRLEEETALALARQMVDSV